MELDKKQKEIVEATNHNIIVIAGSGSGKTKVLTERIRHLIEKKTNPRNIVAITFTNAAAEEMRERLGDVAKDCFIGTIHSYANKLLLMGGYDTSKYINEERFEKFFEAVKNHPEVIQDVEYLLVDEYQDIDGAQARFFSMINPKNFFVVGDDWQNIYSWRGSDVSYFTDLIGAPNFTVYEMGNNYRSAREIIQFAMGFLRPVRDKINKRIVCLNPDEGKVEQITEDLSYFVSEILKNRDFGKWFVLARTNAQVDMVMSTFKRHGIPTDTFKKSQFTNAEIKEKMKEDTVKVLTVHSAKGLENDNVIVIGVHPNSDEERRVAYVAATRAKTRLIWCYAKKKPARYSPSICDWED